MTKPPDQRELIHERDWDYLLIADAARYDLTARVIDEVFTHEFDLYPAWSPAINTLAWLIETWPDEYDITYVSAHAIVNAAGHIAHNSLRRRAEEAGLDHTYSPDEHFAEIVDVWEWGYDERIETVRASAVNDALRDLEDERPAIAHYVQPHFPFVRGPQWAAEQDLDIDRPPRASVAPDHDSYLPTFSKGNVEHVWGEAGVRHAYRENLLYVLDAIDAVLDDLEGRVVVTSDHGTFLKSHEYPPTSENATLRTVPWVVSE